MSSAFEGLPKTPNLKLNKPGYDNVADIEALNENSDILDDEINTIKSNLKNKGSATEPIYFDGNGVPQKTKNFNDYLPLTGGTMTGAIETNGDIINASNNNTFIRIKGSKEYQQGAELLLSGKTLTDHEGLFYLIANNGTKSTKLLGKADGNLLWGAKHIARSVNGINATPDGNINLGIIPVANGGTGATTASNACANLGAVRTINGTGADSDCNVDVNALKTLVIDGILSKTRSYFDGLNVHSLHNRNEEIGELPDTNHSTADSNLLTVKHKDNIEANQIYFNGNCVYYRYNEYDDNEDWSNWLRFDLIESVSLGEYSGYIKYVGGLQICYGRNILATVNAWTYPRAFKYIPIIVCTHNGGTNVVISSSSTTTTSTKTLANWAGGGNINSGETAGDCHIICIGIGV